VKHLTRKLARVATIATAETDSFAALAKLAGLDVSRAFRGADLRNVDFSTDNLAGFNFSSAKLHGADLSRAAGLDSLILTNATADDTTKWPTFGFKRPVAASRPPRGFSPEEVNRRILANEPVPPSWRPSVRDLDFSVKWQNQGKPYPTVRQALERVWAEHPGEVLRSAIPLANFPNLATLNIAGTPITDIAPLASLTALQTLDLWATQVADLAPLASLTALHSLDLWGTQVADLAPLASLTALTTLKLWGTQVTDIAPLASLPNLRRLDLTGLPAGIESILPRRAEIAITRH